MNRTKQLAIITISVIALSLVGYSVFAQTAYTPDAELTYNERVSDRKVVQDLLKKAQYEECLSEVALADAKATDYFNGIRKLKEGEDISALVAKSQKTCVELTPPEVDIEKAKEYVSTVYPTSFKSPSDLFYCFLLSEYTNEKTVSQNQKNHFLNNGYLATDISTTKAPRQMYAMSYMFMDKQGIIHDESRTFTVKLAHNYDTMGQTVELHWNENGEDLAFWIGHVKDFGGLKDGDVVKTGDKIGTSGGCPGELKEGEKSTGCHAHVEFRVGTKITPYPSYKFSLHGEELEARKNPEKSTISASPTVDLDKLAHAFAHAETGDCTKGKGISNNNCFGLKNGSIAPCEKMDKGRFCIYNNKEESYEAFKKVWAKGYGGEFPDYEAAKIWTYNDHPDTWLSNVTHYYNT